MKNKYKKVIKAYNNFNQYQKIFFIDLCAKDIIVPIPTPKGIVMEELCDEAPVCPNGKMIQMNLKDFKNDFKNNDLFDTKELEQNHKDIDKKLNTLQI